MPYIGQDIADVAVTVGQGVITATQIQDASITTADIGNDAITPNKVDDDGTGFQMGSLGLNSSVIGSDKFTLGGNATLKGDGSDQTLKWHNGSAYVNAKLDVRQLAIAFSGTDKVTSDTSGNFNFAGNVQLSNGYQLQWGGTSNAIFGHHTNNYVTIKTNGTDRFTIDSAGTATFSNELRVDGGQASIYGAEGGNAILELNSDEADDNADRWQMYVTANNNYLKWRHYGTGSWVDRLWLSSATDNWAMNLTGNSPYGMQITTTSDGSSSHDAFVIKRDGNNKVFEIFNNGALTTYGSGTATFASVVSVGGDLNVTNDATITSTARYFQVRSHTDNSKITKHGYDGLYTSGAQHQYISSGQDIKFYPGGTHKVTFADGGTASFADDLIIGTQQGDKELMTNRARMRHIDGVADANASFSHGDLYVNHISTGNIYMQRDTFFGGHITVDTGGTSIIYADGNNNSGDDGRIILKGHTAGTSRAYAYFNNGVTSGGLNWYVGNLRGSNAFTITCGNDDYPGYGGGSFNDTVMAIDGNRKIGIRGNPGSAIVSVTGDIYSTSTSQFGSTLVGTVFISSTQYAMIGSNSTSRGIAICRDGSGSLPDFRINGDGSAQFNGSVSKGSGSFKIDHPLPSKKDTHYLVHSFTESPRADLIYRDKVTLVKGKATVNIDEVAGMTEGTFVLLCDDVQCFTSNESDWDAVKGSVKGNILTIECQNSKSTANVSWMVVADRKDQHMMDTNWTDKNGKPIIEPLKETALEGN